MIIYSLTKNFIFNNNNRDYIVHNKHFSIKISTNTRVIEILYTCIKNIVRHRQNTIVNIIFEIKVIKIQFNRCFMWKTVHPYQKRPTAVTFIAISFDNNFFSFAIFLRVIIF